MNMKSSPVRNSYWQFLLSENHSSTVRFMRYDNLGVICNDSWIVNLSSMSCENVLVNVFINIMRKKRK